MSTCTGLAALDYANTKFSKGYEATGCGLILCARHEFIQANGVGDLQKGERFVFVALFWFSVLLIREDMRTWTILQLVF